MSGRLSLDGAALRESVRAMRAADAMLVGVLDDDPTGSQTVQGVQVVTVAEETAFEAAFSDPVGTCFVLTNTRSLGQTAAVELTKRAAQGLFAAADKSGGRIQIVSRSDSTLRGHVIAEVMALHAVRREIVGRGFDAVLFVPAFLEAGRVTAADIHWAASGANLVPVGRTEFATDPVFGYKSSNLRDFIVEKARDAGLRSPAGRGEIRSIGLPDIRLGGPVRIRELIADAHDGSWVVVNATEYADLEAVACAVLQAEREGKSFLFRTGPSFVRALTGVEPRPPLTAEDLWPSGPPAGHGLVVVGSHVGQTNRQLAALRARGTTTEIEVDVPGALSGAGDVVADTAERVTDALRRSDVLVYTSRDVVPSGEGRDSLAIGRTVSAALSRIVRQALAARPRWVVAKGGITSHDLALHGLGIRRAQVAGQLFPGMISVFSPIDAAPAAIGMPYVVFAGNVGDDTTLAQVVAILNGV